jgi:hypothetical protein
MKYFPLWSYKDPDSVMTYVIDDFGMYLVVPYLFIQWLPVKRTPLKMLAYWFLWTGITISIERIFITTNHMSYHKFWTSGHSYLSDWLLFLLFYHFHRFFRLELLSQKEKM